ncbi:flp pilus assembly protein TadG [alpha proteobacterium Q-1]|nr:flp pilus assembly protein TadG [alpha proteobacterium Q-1]
MKMLSVWRMGLCALVKARPLLPSIPHRLWREKSGSMLVWVAVSLIPLVVSVGMATDIARGFVMRSQLNTALDAAALAGGRAFNLPSRDDDVRNYFAANFPSGFMGATLGELEIEPLEIPGEPERLRVSASVEMPTLFMKLVGIEEMSVGTSAEVTRENLGLQAVLVLDHTGSMKGSKINALEDASIDLVDILFGNKKNQPHDRLSIAIVPYSAAVNVGDLGSSFLDFSGIPPEFFYKPNDDRKWKGCVLARETLTSLSSNPNVLDVGAWDISLAPPAVGGKWRPYMYPHWYDNKYRSFPFQDDVDPRDPGKNAGSNLDGVFDAKAYRQGKGPDGEVWSNPNTNPSLGNAYTGPNIGCPAEVMTFNNNYDQVIDYIKDNTIAWSRGGTIGSEGLMWGWRMLDPEPPFPNMVPYNDPATVKALVMMTDGVNEVFRWPHNQYAKTASNGRRSEPENDGSDMPESDYTAYGRLDDGRLGTTNINVAAEAINLRMIKACAAMKMGGVNGQDRVQIYTVIFGGFATENSPRARNLRELYQDCASRPANAFLAPSNEDLRSAFRTIGNDLANLHLSR